MNEFRFLHLDDHGRIDEDLLCRVCDYNLRGLEESADCPECSTPIARSARPDLIQFGDPVWLTRLSRGMSLIIIGLVVSIGANVLMTGLFIAWPELGIAFGTAFGAPGAVVAALSLITITGVWLATTPERGRPEPDGHITVRRTARWCVMVQVVSAPLQMFAGGAGGFAMTPLFIAGAMLGIIALTGQAAGLVYLRRLALRIPAPKLARYTKLVTWGYMSCQVVYMAGVMLFLPVMVASGGLLTSWMQIAMIVFGGGVGLGTLVFSIGALVLLFRYRAVFGHAAQHSKASWGFRAGSPHLG